MARSTLVYAARLAGTPVFDPIGDKVGTVYDVVVLFRLKGEPLAVGLVVEIVGKRRVFLPLTRVTSIDNGQVITTGLVNFRRFAQRPGETLILSQLLERTVNLKENGEKAHVVDAAIERVQPREWHLTTLYVRTERGAGRSGRGHRTLTVPVLATTGLQNPLYSQGADILVNQLREMKPADIADTFRDLPSDRQRAVAASMDDELLADLLEELSEDDQVEVLSYLGSERAASVLDEMSPDDAADLVAELPSEQAAALLSLMEPEDAKDIRRLMEYDERTAGGLMTSAPIILAPDQSVAEALAAARRSDIPPALAAIMFVCRPPLETPTGRFLGAVHIQRLLREPPSTMIGSVLDTAIENVRPDDGIGKLTRLLATYDLTALPVVDEDGTLLGAVSVDDILDHLLPEDWRDADEDVIDETVEASHV